MTNVADIISLPETRWKAGKAVFTIRENGSSERSAMKRALQVWNVTVNAVLFLRASEIKFEAEKLPELLAFIKKLQRQRKELSPQAGLPPGFAVSLYHNDTLTKKHFTLRLGYGVKQSLDCSNIANDDVVLQLVETLPNLVEYKQWFGKKCSGKALRALTESSLTASSSSSSSSLSSLELLNLYCTEFDEAEFDEAALIELIRASKKCVRLDLSRVQCINGVTTSDATLNAITETCGDRLQELSLRGADVTEEGLIALFDTCKHIEALNVCRVGRGKAVTDNALRHLDLGVMKRIDISRCRNVTERGLVDVIAKTATRNLVCFSCEHDEDDECDSAVTDAFLAAFAESPASQTLETLDISSQLHVTETGLMTVATRFPKLQMVYLDSTGSGEGVTDAVLRALAENLGHRLQRVWFSKQQRVTEAGLADFYKGCAKLESLNVMDDQPWTDAVIEAVAASEAAASSINDIDFWYTKHITSKSVLALVSRCSQLSSFACYESYDEGSIYPISAEVMAKLAECPNLKRAYICSRTELEAALKEFKIKRPDVTLNYV